MNISDPIQSREKWLEYLADLKRRTRSPHYGTSEPESYPVICIYDEIYDAHHATYHTNYELVYLEDFIKHDDKLLGQLAERHKWELQKIDECEHGVWCGNWCHACNRAYREAAIANGDG